MLPIGTVLCFLAAVAGCGSMTAWLVFQADLDQNTAEGVSVAPGLGLICTSGAWVAAGVASALYYKDWRGRVPPLSKETSRPAKGGGDKPDARQASGFETGSK